MVEYLSLRWIEDFLREDRLVRLEAWNREECSLNTEKLIALPRCIQEFMTVKGEILAEARASGEVFAKFGLTRTLDRCYDVYREESNILVEQLPHLIFDPQSTFDEELFSSAVRGNTNFGMDILNWFKTELTQMRAEQLITWLMNSGASILAYARVSVTPNIAQNMLVEQQVSLEPRKVWKTSTAKRKGMPEFSVPMVAG